MNSPRQIPSIPSLVIALSSAGLGAITTLDFTSRDRTRPGPSFVLFNAKFSFLIALSVFVTLMVILKMIKEKRSRLERDLLEAFLEHIPDNVYFKDRNSRFLRVNNAMAAYFGFHNPEQLRNKTDADIFSNQHAHEALIDEQKIISTGQPVVGLEEKETWPNGRESWVLTTKVPLQDRQGKVIGTMGISHDITERKQTEARIKYMALHDALTGLPNRISLSEKIAQAISLAHRNQKRVAVLMLDLDRFKTVNDSFGHYAGDCLLEAVAKRMKATLRESDIVARWGGDEFVVCLPEAPDNQAIEEVVQKLSGALSEPFQIEGHSLQIGSSIGICQYPSDGENPESLLEIADAAMYESKKRGRGTYTFFTPELTQATRRRKKLEGDLRQACARGEFVLHYQPLVAMATNQITGVEALLRWHHPELGLIAPNEFIPLLEELGLMADVGRWVLRTACFQNIAWQNRGLVPVRVAVNVSAQQFYRGNIVKVVQEVLQETNLDPMWLELELTESLTVDNSESAIEIMRDLKQIGISLSLDDFGTGWSSLSYLRQFPLDRIKIDRSFLRDIELYSSSEAVVRSILNLGKNLGLTCVAEGVETSEQLEYLQNQKCAEMQGFLFSRALPAEECAALMVVEELLQFPECVSAISR